MLEGVTIEQLRTLRAVAEAGSFSAAARKLGRVQAAVSQAIDRLEGQLGLTLFDRTGRVPRLTAHGEALVAAAARVTGELNALDELARDLKRGAETRLAIAVDALFPTAALVDFAKEFAAAHACVELVLVSDVMSSVTAWVRERRATLGVAVEDADLRDLDRRPIGRVELVPVAAPTHPLAARAGLLDAPALADAVQIVLSEQRRGATTPPSDDRGVLSPRTWRVADLATKRALIAAALGWGHLPEHDVRDDLAAGRLSRLRLEAWGGEGTQRALLLVHRRGARLGPVARWAEERLVDLCRRDLHPTT